MGPLERKKEMRRDLKDAVPYGLMIAGAVVLASALWANDLNRYLEWDEAAYLTETMTGVRPIGFDAHRARGVSLLVAPIAAVGASLPMLRTYLMCVAVVGMILAYGTWRTVRPSSCVVACVLFGTTWPALFYATELSPNLFVGLTAVGLSGMLSSGARRPNLRRLGTVALLSAALFTLRPLDAVIVTVPVCLFLARGDRLHELLSVVLGTGIGVSAWAVEAVVRFGGPFERLARATTLIGSNRGFHVLEHLRLADGTLIGPDRDPSVAWQVVLWLCLFAVLVAVGSWSRPELAQWSVFPGISLLAAYTTLVDVAAPRFLLPAYALLSVAAGEGFIRIVKSASHRRSTLRAGIAMLGGTALVVIMPWHLATAREVADEQKAVREVPRELGSVIDATAGGPCAFASEYGYPQIEFASACRGTRLDVREPDRAIRCLDMWYRSGVEVFVLLVHNPRGSPDFESWNHRRYEASDGTVWKIYGPSKRAGSTSRSGPRTCDLT